MELPKNFEVWRIIDGYSNYEVSSHGRIRNNRTDRILKPSPKNSYGHLNIDLCKNGKRKSYLLHRLVGFAFCDNPNNYNCIDHIDRNPKNNHYENLRWVTHSQNSRNKTTYKNNRSGKQGVSFKNDSKSWKAKINNDGKEITRSFSIKKYGIDNAKERAVDWRKNKEQEFGYIGE